MSGESHIDFLVKKDGHESAVAGNPAFNQVELRRIDKRQSEVTEKKDGAVVSTLRVKISADGDELRVTTTRRGHADMPTVWTRSGGAKVSGDPMAGEWREDRGKTRMAQGLRVKFEAAGNNGVRFEGEFSYTARFDGRQYDLVNSRNDTVTLQLVDARTVDAFYQRDNRQTEKERWVVSADHQMMTLTSIGTFETGQHMAEKLVFKRQ